MSAINSLRYACASGEIAPLGAVGARSPHPAATHIAISARVAVNA